jgi:hypothetical protein
MNRQITSHKLNGLNDALRIVAEDDPGMGGANHIYSITHYGTPQGYEGLGIATGSPVGSITFQKGPIQEFGVNGLSNESLLAIVIDRLQCFQNGEYKCRENAIALTHLEDAMHWLHHRTRERMSRCVEGTSTK